MFCFSIRSLWLHHQGIPQKAWRFITIKFMRMGWCLDLILMTKHSHYFKFLFRFVTSLLVFIFDPETTHVLKFPPDIWSSRNGSPDQFRICLIEFNWWLVSPSWFKKEGRMRGVRVVLVWVDWKDESFLLVSFGSWISWASKIYNKNYF